MSRISGLGLVSVTAISLVVFPLTACSDELVDSSEAEITPRTAPSAKVTQSPEVTTESQEESGGLSDLIEDSAVVVATTCTGSDISSIELDSYAKETGGEDYYAKVLVDCGGSGEADAHLIRREEDVNSLDGALFGISDPTKVGEAGGVVPEGGFRSELSDPKYDIPYARGYEIDGVNNLSIQETQCWAIGLSDGLSEATAHVRITTVGPDNKAIGTERISCAIIPPGVVK